MPLPRSTGARVPGRRREGLGRQLPILPPQQDEGQLRAAGFADVELFYAAGLFRAWIALA